MTTLSGGDITHAVPDNTGYITEGQLYLRKDSDVGKVIVDPFRSLSRLKQLVTGKKTREDHPQVMNAAVRLYADAANAKTKMENGFDLTDYDNRTLAFAKDYSEKLLAIDVNLDTTEMLDVAWNLFGEYFEPAEVNIKQALVDKYWVTGKLKNERIKNEENERIKKMKGDSAIRVKSMDFAIRIIKLRRFLQNAKEFDLSSQVARSGTAIGALIREAEYAESKAGFCS